MAYNQKLIAVVKCGGKILRETGDAVHVPFGSEYSILFKNQESRRVQISVSIDGEDILNGRMLIVEGNSEVELERFLENDNSRGRRFRFIKKTDEIIASRGDRIDDGTIRIEYRFEAKPAEVVRIETTYVPNQWPVPYIPPYRPQPPFFGWTINSAQGVYTVLGTSAGINALSLSNGCASAGANTTLPTPLPDEGLTVKGSESRQSFINAYMGTLENASHTIVLRLKGTSSDGVPLTKIVTTRDRIECPTCGNTSKSGRDFCWKCGTSLKP